MLHILLRAMTEKFNLGNTENFGIQDSAMKTKTLQPHKRFRFYDRVIKNASTPTANLGVSLGVIVLPSGREIRLRAILPLANRCNVRYCTDCS